MRARYYNPRLMRFCNADPIGFRGGLNRYAFCENDPISYLDPWGLKDSRAQGPRPGTNLGTATIDGRTYTMTAGLAWEVEEALGFWGTMGAGLSGAGEGLYYAGKGLVNAPLRFGQTVVSGYSQLGDFIGGSIVDPGLLARDVGNMATRPVQTMQAAASVAWDMGAAVVQHVATQAQTSEGRGELWGDLTFAAASAGAFGNPNVTLELWKYKGAGGGGINVLRRLPGAKPESLIRFDFHRLGKPPNQVWRPHVDIPSNGVHHWPWKL